jgi:Leu/Phe-tRNA-protein transferase
MELKIAEVSDIEATLKLHAKYQIDSIAEEDKKDGFVTTAFSKEELTELIVKEQGLFLVKKEDEVLAYVMAASWNFWSKWAMFEEMIKDLKNLKYMGKTLSIENSYQYGPVCLDKSIRGTGILEKIFNFSREMMSQRYPILVTFINKKNSRSFEAHHRKLGLEVIQEFSYNGNEYYEMVYDTSVALTGKGLIAMIDSPIEHLPYSSFFDEEILHDKIYANMHQHYYWSDDFSAEYYIAQAQAGFIAVSMKREGTLYLTPEIQKEYALLDFENLHVSKKVKKLIKSKNLKIEILEEFDALAEKIQEYHTFCWFNKAYVQILHEVNELDENCKIIGVLLNDGEKMIAGEVGYVIGRTYTSLTGFSSREKAYRNYGTAQLVLLSQYLEENGFEFLNLGQPYMQYKLDLGAEIYDRHEFLNRWNFASRKINKEQ